MSPLLKYPQNPFPSLQADMNRFIGDVQKLLSRNLSSKDLQNLIISPSIDIIEDDKNFKIEAELPGLDENDIKLSINQKALTIRAQKEISKKDDGKNYIVREIGYGNYERHIPLPDYVDIDNIHASFKKGMLWINLPKKAGEIKNTREVKIEKG